MHLLKIIIRTIVLLVIVNIALLYIHYSQLADASGKTVKESRYVQEIEVINRAEALIVKHHFRELNSNRHEIVLPVGSTNLTCFLENETSCKRINENVTAFLEGEQSEQSISYEIPKDGPMDTRKLFKEPFASLKNETPIATTLHITDETGIGGMWLSGLQLVGNKKMELIDYSLFKGQGQITDLYWQKNAVPIAYKGKYLSVYGDRVDEKLVDELDSDFSDLKVHHLDIVLDKSGDTLKSDRFILSNEPVSALTNEVLEKGVRSQFRIPEVESFSANLLASILLEAPTGTTKTKEAYVSLRSVLSEKQFTTLKTQVNENRGNTIDAAAIDKMISQISGMSTSFVQKNIEGNYPFLFEDSRVVELGGKVQEDLRVIVKDKQTFYPIEQLLTSFGYKVSANDKSLYIESASEKYRFSLRDPFYVLNEKKYTLREAPYELFGEDYYFDEDALRRLFHLSIQKSENTITINSLTGGKTE